MKNVLSAVLLTSLLGCATHDDNSGPIVVTPDAQLENQVMISEWAEIKINPSGQVFVNEKQVNLAQFASECQRLKKAGGGAIVYTGDGEHVLTPPQAEAFKTLVAAGLPMKVGHKDSELN